jgi:hypothetical protein
MYVYSGEQTTTVQAMKANNVTDCSPSLICDQHALPLHHHPPPPSAPHSFFVFFLPPPPFFAGYIN